MNYELWGQQRAGLWFLMGFSPDAMMQEVAVQANVTAGHNDKLQQKLAQKASIYFNFHVTLWYSGFLPLP